MSYNNYYLSDRKFSDVVHEKLACKLIYPKLNWCIQNTNSNVLNNIDTRNAIDYIAIDKNNSKMITIQERFRDKKYNNYSDFTIRYKREYSKFNDRKHSEYFKLDADYFVYGIIDQEKVRVYDANEFLKFCVIDIKKLKEYIDIGKIIISENTNKKQCFIEKNCLVCPVINNRDFSSSFFPVDIVLLAMLFDDTIIISQDGFIQEKK